MRRPATGSGRPQATDRATLSTLAVDIFTENGFESTSVDDIAAAAGIARRTLFRYFPSKNAIPWGDFDYHLDQMRQRLARLPADLSLGETLRRALLAFNEVPDDEVEHHRRRMALVLGTPALQAHSMLMYAEWRQVIAEHAGERLGVPASAQVPQTIAWLLLGTALSAYQQWLDDPAADLLELLDAGCAILIDSLSV
ncbi:mycofactocin system transcriptional regulator [Gordonia sp. VNK21]|uniref:mycofactocin system transcriptional regulator n=1 Tax=Gordonia sp. VNK21 TaxID=3382483 RepID=UPI0038D3845E